MSILGFKLLKGPPIPGIIGFSLACRSYSAREQFAARAWNLEIMSHGSLLYFPVPFNGRQRLTRLRFEPR
jgi:hypothetical protein